MFNQTTKKFYKTLIKSSEKRRSTEYCCTLKNIGLPIKVITLCGLLDCPVFILLPLSRHNNLQNLVALCIVSEQVTVNGI